MKRDLPGWLPVPGFDDSCQTVLPPNRPMLVGTVTTGRYFAFLYYFFKTKYSISLEFRILFHLCSHPICIWDGGGSFILLTTLGTNIQGLILVHTNFSFGTNSVSSPFQFDPFYKNLRPGLCTKGP